MASPLAMPQSLACSCLDRWATNTVLRCLEIPRSAVGLISTKSGTTRSSVPHTDTSAPNGSPSRNCETQSTEHQHETHPTIGNPQQVQAVQGDTSKRKVEQNC